MGKAKLSTKNAAQELRRKRIAELFLSGVRRQQAIADVIGCSRQTVQLDMPIIRAEWRERMATAYDEALDEEVAELDRIAGEAWAAWEKSKTKRQRMLARTKKPGKDGEPETIQEMIEENQCGNPRYLDIAKDCVAKRCRLRGLDIDKPEQHLHIHGEMSVWDRLAQIQRPPDQIELEIEKAGGNGEVVDAECKPTEGGGDGLPHQD